MLNIIQAAKKALLISLATTLLTVPVGGVLAEGDTSDTCTPPPATENGVHWPVGADAGTFEYKCEGTYAGYWINDYYIYDPATTTRTPRYELNYRYDCTAQKWYVNQWFFSAAQGVYQETEVETTAPTGQATNCPVAEPPKTVDTDGDGVYDSAATPEALAAAQANGGSVLSQDGTANTTINNGTTATMNNGILSFAASGDALVTGNTTGGSATSGNAQAIANIINMLQSSSNVLADPDMIIFTADINGDVNGDLLLDPAKLGSVQDASVSTAVDSNLLVNNSANAAINNNILLDAESGDATVSQNTSAGDATTFSNSGASSVLCNKHTGRAARWGGREK